MALTEDRPACRRAAPCGGGNKLAGTRSGLAVFLVWACRSLHCLVKPRFRLWLRGRVGCEPHRLRTGRPLGVGSRRQPLAESQGARSMIGGAREAKYTQKLRSLYRYRAKSCLPPATAARRPPNWSRSPPPAARSKPGGSSHGWWSKRGRIYTIIEGFIQTKGQKQDVIPIH